MTLSLYLLCVYVLALLSASDDFVVANAFSLMLLLLGLLAVFRVARVSITAIWTDLKETVGELTGAYTKEERVAVRGRHSAANKNTHITGLILRT